MPKKKTPARPTKMIHIRMTETVHRKLVMGAAKQVMTIQSLVTKVIEGRLADETI